MALTVNISSNLKLHVWNQVQWCLNICFSTLLLSAAQQLLAVWIDYTTRLLQAIDQFPFQENIALEMAARLAHLHDLGIIDRDIKPANVLVFTQHYCTLDDRQELEHVFQTRPIICKLADFGECRSVINQESNVCRMLWPILTVERPPIEP